MSTQVAELACTYAALILHDDGQDITGDKIATLIKAAGVNVEAYWPKLFAKAVEGQDITTFFSFGGAAQSNAPVTSQPAAKEAPKQEAKKQEKKVKQQPKVQQQEDGGMGGLFD